MLKATRMHRDYAEEAIAENQIIICRGDIQQES